MDPEVYPGHSNQSPENDLLKNGAPFHKGILISAFAGLFFFGILDNGRGPAYPEILKGLELNNLQGSLLFALTSLISFIVTIISHHWLKYFGLVKSMRTGWLILSVASLLLGVSGLLDSRGLLFIAAFIQGLGMGVVGMNMNLMVEAATTPLFRRRAYGVLHAVYGIASLLAPLLYTATRTQFTWPYFFIFLSLIGPILFYLLPREQEVFAKLSPKQDQSKTPLGLMLMLGLAIGSYVASEIVVSSRLVLFLEDGQGFKNSEAGLYLSAFFAFLMLGRISLGLFHLPVKGPTLLFTSLIFTALFCILGIRGQYFFFSLTGLSMSILFPSFMDWVAEAFPNDFQKVTQFVLSGIGLHLVLMHLGFGQLANKIGVVKAMELSLWLTLISLLALSLAFIWLRIIRK